ncbi:hypothetical protein PVAND_014297 [Polypedilum vanderplanki]|uniref:Uncharacterized protein n=1 Tax=Polypedilum vanderplanki TaxID=319348 RepID=A0A9J6CSY1_POLVA|nr:hypothetical protein PVAND_014297 [Polypedilum vanderplanki]
MFNNNYLSESEVEDQEILQNDNIELDSNVVNENVYYNNKDESKVKEHLVEMGFECLVPLFINEYIDLEVFYNLNASLIQSILKNFPVGFTYKFEKAYTHWRSNNDDLIAMSSVISSNENVDISLKFMKGCILNILNSDEESKRFLEALDVSNPFTKNERKELMKHIIAYFYRKKITLRKDQIKKLADCIEKDFPHEKSSSYFNPDTGNGKLYHKFHNELKSMKREKLMPSSSLKRKRIEEKEVANSNLFSESELKSDKFVQQSAANLDFVLLKQHWIISSKVRNYHFRNEKNKASLFDNYKTLLRPDGHILISLDFGVLYPDHLDFINEWKLNFIKFEKILRRDGKDDISYDKFSQNQRVAFLMYALHCYLYSPGMKFVNGSRIRPTRQDTFEFFLLLCTTENAMEEEHQIWLNKIKSRNLTQQAIIIGYGTSFENIQDKFCVCIENTKYIFNSLILAIECLLKVYYVFDIEFPIINSQCYIFLSKKFLGLKSNMKTVKGSKVNELLNAFQ